MLENKNLDRPALCIHLLTQSFAKKLIHKFCYRCDANKDQPHHPPRLVVHDDEVGPPAVPRHQEVSEDLQRSPALFRKP